jgi:hypothetical protein
VEGMTIDETIIALERDIHNARLCGYQIDQYKVAIDTMRKYQQLQADYENRLKADMVAMLEELKEQLREMHEDFFETEHFDEAYGVSDSMDVIQEKINELKGDNNEQK